MNDAAEEVLKRASKPIGYKSLANQILKDKLVQSKSKTPHSTLYASITLEGEDGKNGAFLSDSHRTGRDWIVAVGRTDSYEQILNQAKKLRDDAKADLLKRLGRLPGPNLVVH